MGVFTRHPRPALLGADGLSTVTPPLRRRSGSSVVSCPVAKQGNKYGTPVGTRQGTKAHIEGMHQGSRCNDIQNCQILGPQKKLGSRVNCPSVTPATRWATANIAAVAINFECGA